VRYYWNGLKKGRHGDYPLNAKKGLVFGDNDYIGHNIAAIAVNDRGQVIDFEFNHNQIFNSSAEHAEARLVKRIFGMGQVMDAYSGSRKPIRCRTDYDTFEDVTVYTSLESCSQCSGIMALARVKQVVYLQADPGMYRIGYILRNLTKPIVGVNAGAMVSPVPVTGTEIDLPLSAELDHGYSRFIKKVKGTPFFIPHDKTKEPDHGPSITSFLCTKSAFRIYERAEQKFRALHPSGLSHPRFRPTQAHAVPPGEILTNAQALSRAKRFFQYATIAGRRGTPHP
jgi:tRNA(Arg) A34 adenosine deaminase TadA